MLFAVEKAISENEFYRRRHGSSARRGAQDERMAMGLLGANVDNMAHGKVWCVYHKRRDPLILKDDTAFHKSPQSLISSGHIGAPWKYTSNFSTHFAVTRSPLRYPAELPIHGLSSRISKMMVGTPNGKLCARSRSIVGAVDETVSFSNSEDR
jgi:hypothetical protein